MGSKPEIAALLEQVRTAPGRDRGLDGLIARDLEGWLPAFDLEGADLLDWPHMGGHWHLPGDPCDGRHSWNANLHPDPPAYTASVDAALALVERMLPGWWLHGLGKSPLHGLWWCQLYSLDDQEAAESDEVKAAPLAILAALLTALEAQP